MFVLKNIVFFGIIIILENTNVDKSLDKSLDTNKNHHFPTLGHTLQKVDDQNIVLRYFLSKKVQLIICV